MFISLDARSALRAIDVRQPQTAPSHLFGRYSLSGDTLKVCFGESNRPVGLSDGEGTFGVWVFKRKER
jgi:hypothetical protein